MNNTSTIKEKLQALSNVRKIHEGLFTQEACTARRLYLCKTFGINPNQELSKVLDAITEEMEIYQRTDVAPEERI